MAFVVGVPTPTILPSSVNSVENIAKFHHHLKTYLYNIAYSLLLCGISINLMTTVFVY